MCGECPLPCGDVLSVHLWRCARAPEHPPDLLTSTSVMVGLENIYHHHQDAHGGGLDGVCVCVCVFAVCVNKSDSQGQVVYGV